MSTTELTVEDCATILVVCITPRNPDGSIDADGARRNVDYLIDSGAGFIMPMCGTGLVYDVGLAEYEAVVGTFVDQAGSRALIVPGVGPGFGRSLEMAEIARSVGAAGVMIMPIVGPASDNGVRTGLESIARRAQLPTILYQRRLDVMPVDHVVGLCGLDEVVGLKYAVDDLSSFGRIVDSAGHAAAMVCGMAEDPSIDYLKAGAVGFSSGMANFVPRMSLELLRAFRSGDLQEAERLRGEMVPFEDLRGEDGARYSASALHAAMNYAGLAGGPVIPFAEPVADADLARLHQMMSQLMPQEERLREEPLVVGQQAS